MPESIPTSSLREHRLQPLAPAKVDPLPATRKRIRQLFKQPFTHLLWQAGDIHRQSFPRHQVQLSALCNIKTGGCSEDCAYCPQSAHFRHETGLRATPVLSADHVEQQAKQAKDNGAQRFCMGAAWRSLPQKQLDKMIEMIARVKALGMQTCMTLGMLTSRQAQQLADGGLDYYNHNLDTSPEYYPKIISTRTYRDRLRTLAHIREAGISVCSGGIVGMGESREDRVGLLAQLSEIQPQSVPINHLVSVAGTRLENTPPLDPLEFVRVIAVARIMMPHSWLRLSAGRENMPDELQALCFSAGANSIFLGEKLLTVNNREPTTDHSLLTRLGLQQASDEPTRAPNLNHD